MSLTLLGAGSAGGGGTVAPVLAAIEGTALEWVEGDGATAITASLTVTDADSNIASATVTISSNYQSGEDVLDNTDSGGVTGSWDSGTGVLTLSGEASAATYQTVLRSVTYNNTEDAPNESTRTVTFQVTDADTNTSNSVTRDITVLDVIARFRADTNVFKDDAADLGSCADSSGNGYTGTLTNFTDAQKIAAWRTDVPSVLAGDGVFAIELFGGDEEIAISSAVQPTSSAMSVSAWIKIDAIPPDPYRIVAADDAFTPPYMMTLRPNDLPGPGTIQWYIDSADGQNYIYSDNAVPTGEWVHVAGVYDGTDIRVYINGSLDCTPASLTGNVDSVVVGTVIGSWEDDEYFQGVISDLRLYTSALTAQNISDLYSGSDVGTPEAHWKMNDGPSTDAGAEEAVTYWLDSINRHRKYQTTAANRPVLKTGEDGIGGQPALYFDQTNDGLIDDTSDYYTGTVRKIAGAFRCEDVAGTGTDQTIVAFSDTSNNSNLWALEIDDSTGKVQITNSSGTTVFDIVLQDELDYTYEVVKDGTDITITVTAGSTLTDTQTCGWIGDETGLDNVTTGGRYNDTDGWVNLFLGLIAEELAA